MFEFEKLLCIVIRGLDKFVSTTHGHEKSKNESLEADILLVFYKGVFDPGILVSPTCTRSSRGLLSSAVYSKSPRSRERICAYLMCPVKWKYRYVQVPFSKYKYVRKKGKKIERIERYICLLYTSPSPRDRQKSRMPSSA